MTEADERETVARTTLVNGDKRDGGEKSDHNQPGWWGGLVKLTGSFDARLIAGLCGLAAIGTLLVRPAPTGIGWWDATLTVVFVSLVVLAGARGTLATLGWVSAVAVIATALSNPTVWIVFALVGFGLAWLAGSDKTMTLPDSVIGSAACVVSILALFRLGDIWRWGTPSVLTAIAVVPLLFVAWRSLRPNEQVIFGKFAAWSSIGLLVCVVSLLITAALAQGPARSARSAAERAQAALDEGDTKDATAQLALIAASLDDAQGTVNGWVSAPARLLPVVSQHLSIGGTGLRHAAALSEAAADGAAEFDIDQLRGQDGAVDIEQVRALVSAVNGLDTVLQPAATEFAVLDDDWLVPPIADVTQRASRELASAARASAQYRPLMQVAPELLGNAAPVRYFVLFGTPAEARELGGLLGAYAVVEVDNGRVSLLEAGNNSDLINRSQAEDLTLDVEGYSEFFVEIYEPDTYAQNFTGIPDLTFAANAIQDVFGEFAGAPLDGVVYLDPYAVEAIVGLTGPLRVDGLQKPLNGRTTADFLLKDQYVQFDDPEERKAFLVTMLEQTFSSLLGVDISDPRRVTNLLLPVVQAGRLQVTMFDEDINERLARTDLLRRWPENTGSDFLSLLESNAAPTKLDAYLYRDWAYDLTFDPETGKTSGTVTLTLTSTATPDLPAYVTSPDEEIVGLEERRPQDNWTFVSLITPLNSNSVTVNGVPEELVAFNELGYARWFARASVAPERPTVIVWEVEGALNPGDYTLRVAHQPLVNDDRVRITVTPSEGWLLSGSESVTWSFRLNQNVTLESNAIRQ